MTPSSGSSWPLSAQSRGGGPGSLRWFKGDLGDVRRVEVLPGNRLRVTLGQRSRLYPNVLSNPRLKVGHPKHLMEQRIQQGEVNVAPLDVGVVGTGPFRLAEYERDSVVRLRRFEAYWEKDAGANRLPYLEGSTL